MHVLFIGFLMIVTFTVKAEHEDYTSLLLRRSGLSIEANGLKKIPAEVNQRREKGRQEATLKFSNEEVYKLIIETHHNGKMKTLTEANPLKARTESGGVWAHQLQSISFSTAGQVDLATSCHSRYKDYLGPDKRTYDCISVSPQLCANLGDEVEKLKEHHQQCQDYLNHVAKSLKNLDENFKKLEEENMSRMKEIFRQVRANKTILGSTDEVFTTANHAEIFAEATLKVGRSPSQVTPFSPMFLLLETHKMCEHLRRTGLLGSRAITVDTGKRYTRPQVGKQQ